MNPVRTRRSLTEEELVIMVSSTETSQDTEEDNSLASLLANLELAQAEPAQNLAQAEPAQNEIPPPKPPFRLFEKQESFIDPGELLQLRHAITTDVQRAEEPKINPLPGFIELISNRQRFKKVKDPTRELAIKGRNILHYIAEQQDFGQYVAVIKKLSKRSWFDKLIQQKEEGSGRTPLHVICSSQNVCMLQTLCAIEKIQDILRLSGIQYTQDTRHNAFLCFGSSLLDSRIAQVNSVALFKLLVKLYGEEASVKQIGNSLEDDENRKFTALVFSSKQNDLIEAVCTLMQNEMK